MHQAQGRFVRAFISSPFEDMHREREELCLRVLPAIRSACEAKGATWHDVDLRWGLLPGTEQEDVIASCLSEVHRCQELFLCVLGDRYGTRINSFSQQLVEDHPWLRGREGRSITELEIVNAIETANECGRSLYFYFREPSRESHDESSELQRRLKAFIRKTSVEPHCHVREGFLDAHGLGVLVQQDLLAHLADSLGERAPDTHDLESLTQDDFVRTMTSHYVPRDDLESTVHTYLRSDSNHPLVVVGEAGSGKSTLLAACLTAARLDHAKLSEPVLFGHFVDASPTGNTLKALLSRAVSSLGAHVPQRTESSRLAVLRHEFSSCLRRATHARPMILFLDGVDRLSDSDRPEAVCWLPTPLPHGVKAVLSVSDSSVGRLLAARGAELLELKPLTRNQIGSLSQSYLSQFGKSLSLRQVEQLASCDSSRNALFLVQLLEDLRSLGSPQALARRIPELVGARGLSELTGLIIARLRSALDEVRPGVADDVLRLIGATRSGLSDHELMTLLEGIQAPLSPLEWSRVAGSLLVPASSCFGSGRRTPSSGRWDTSSDR